MFGLEVTLTFVPIPFCPSAAAAIVADVWNAAAESNTVLSITVLTTGSARIAAPIEAMPIAAAMNCSPDSWAKESVTPCIAVNIEATEAATRAIEAAKTEAPNEASTKAPTIPYNAKIAKPKIPA